MDCGLFVIGYAMAKLRGLPLQVFDQANMPAMREALAEDLLGLGTKTTVKGYIAGHHICRHTCLLSCHQVPVLPHLRQQQQRRLCCSAMTILSALVMQ